MGGWEKKGKWKRGPRLIQNGTTRESFWNIQFSTYDTLSHNNLDILNYTCSKLEKLQQPPLHFSPLGRVVAPFLVTFCVCLLCPLSVMERGIQNSPSSTRESQKSLPYADLGDFGFPYDGWCVTGTARAGAQHSPLKH